MNSSDNFGFVPYGSHQEEVEDFGFTPNQVQQQPKQSFTGNESVDSTIRYLMQPVQGFLATTTPGIAAGFWQLLGTGEALDDEEIDRIQAISEREGVPFDREKYVQAAQNALNIIPTVSNIAHGIEERTGAPLEPETRGQKALRFFTEGSRLAPQQSAFRGTNVALPKPVLGAGVTAAKEAMQQVGVPEPLAELGSFGILKHVPEGAAKLEFGRKKPSGMPERGFERLTEPTDVPAKKIKQINDKLENDFRQVSDKIIQESPIGETARNLAEDPRFKRDSKELLDQAQIIANNTPGTLPSMQYKQALLKQSQNQIKGFALNEYKKNYLKFMKEAVEDVIPENVTFGELVEQYRDNNRSLGEYFEPGSSKALNRAKRDVLLDQNRAIASVIEQTNPELSNIFKEGNERWTKIMDAETIDKFISDIFPEGKKVDFKHMKEMFDDPNYQRIFKRSLGEEGAKNFEQALEDMLTAERPYKMLREAQDKGLADMFVTAKAYLVHPYAALAKTGADAARYAYRTLINATLDQPRIGLTFTKAVKNLESGNFAKAAEGFKTVQAEIETPSNRRQTTKEAKSPRNEVVDVEAELVNRQPEALGQKTSHVNESRTKPKDDLSSIGGIGSAISDNFYSQVFDSLKKGIDTISGVKDPFLKAAKPSYDAGLIKNTDDLKRFSKFYYEAKQNKFKQ